MSTLAVYPPSGGAATAVAHDPAAIADRLGQAGVLFEQWRAEFPLPVDADQDQVLQAYAKDVERLKQRFGFATADVIAVPPDHPQRAELRGKFLNEHTHDDFEVRFFVAGQGLFYLHLATEVCLVLCEAGDLLSVPADTSHWFDMGSRPNLKVIRLFTTPEGWVAKFTGSDIAQHFPSFDAFIAAQL